MSHPFIVKKCCFLLGHKRSHGQKGGVTCMDALMPQAHGCAGAAYNT
ncbi:MAG: hypothetical protein V3T17_18380 [Pseudomonadales bacterium]